MLNPISSTEAIVGPVQWTTPVEGFCRCPGHDWHTGPSGPKDCRVRIDGVPTIYCFHKNCATNVSAANLLLRTRLNAEDWTLTLPGGRILRSGDSLGPKPRPAPQVPGTNLLLAALEREIHERGTDLLEQFHWPYVDIVAQSPVPLSHREREEQFRLWLKLWPAHSIVWIGDVFHSGQPQHATHFRPVADWYQAGPVMGNFTCPSTFARGSMHRSDTSIVSREFLVVESDTLSRDQVGAVFLYLARRLGYRMHCIVDTAGKSLHGWFSPPPRPHEEALKVALTAFGCDPKLFTPSQPVRVPGALRDGKPQKLIWLRD